MSEDKFKRRLTPIFSANIEGYGFLMRKDNESTIRTLILHFSWEKIDRQEICVKDGDGSLFLGDPKLVFLINPKRLSR